MIKSKCVYVNFDFHLQYASILVINSGSVRIFDWKVPEWVMSHISKDMVILKNLVVYYFSLLMGSWFHRQKMTDSKELMEPMLMKPMLINQS